MLLILAAPGAIALLTARGPGAAGRGALALLAAVLALNLTFTCELHASALCLARLVLVAVLGLALAAIVRDGGTGAVAGTALAAGVVASLVAIWQGLFGFSLDAAALRDSELPIRDAALARLASGRVFGTFLLPASLGGALSVTIPITTAVLWFDRRTRVRGIAGAALVIQAAALVWSFSLGAWISLAGSVLLILGGGLVRGRRARRWIAAVSVVGAVAVLGLFAARRILLTPAGPADEPVAYRIGNWSAACAMIVDHPLYGTGLGTFGNVYPAYRREGMNESRYAHSTWLQLTSEMGIGVVPLLALVPFWAAGLAGRGIRAGPLGSAGAIGIVAFLVQNGFDFTFYQPSVGALFVLAAALAARAGDAGDEWPASSVAPEGSGADPRHGGAEFGAPGVSSSASSRGAAIGVSPRGAFAGSAAWLLALCASVFLVLSGLSGLARERAIRAHGLDSEVEVRSLVLAARLDPLNPRAHAELAGILATRAAQGTALEPALAEAARAVALDPRSPGARRELAEIELRAGRPAAAWISLAAASARYPLQSDYRRDRDALERKLFEPPPPADRSAPGGAPEHPAASGPVRPPSVGASETGPVPEPRPGAPERGLER